MTVDGHEARVEVPAAVAADRNDDGRIIELRVYWSMWPLTGKHHHHPPLLESALASQSPASSATTSAPLRPATPKPSWRHLRPTPTSCP